MDVGPVYKSKGPFARLQTAPKRFDVVQVNRHFFGSRHGKNPSDGVSANVKNKATRAVRCRRAVIQNAEDLFKFLHDNMTVTADGCSRHNSRHFVFVSKEEIRRETIACVPLKGTRQVHSLKADGSGECLHYRNLTCNCQGCSNGTACQNSQQIKEWQTQNMFQPRFSDKEITCGQSTNDRTSVCGANNDTSITACEKSADSCLGLLSESTLEYLEELNEGVEAGAAEVAHAVVEETLAHSKEPATVDQTVGDAKHSLVKSKDTILPGGWVAASFPGKILKVYLGTVLEVDGNEASVKFCRQHGSHFTWPAVDDIGWMPMYSLTPVEAPSLDAREKMTLNNEAFMRYFK